MIEHLMDNPWWWLVLAVLFGIGEIVTPGIFLIWIAMAAALTGLLAMLLPIPVAVQFVLFALFSLVAVWGGRRWYADNPVTSQDPLLNDRAARLIGRTVTVVDPIVNGEGRVRIDDGTWTASGPDAEAGSRLVVISADGPTLKVDWPPA